MKRTLLFGMASLLCASPSFANLIGVDVTGDLSGIDLSNLDAYGVIDTATVGAGVEFSAPGEDFAGNPIDGLLTLDLQGADGHDVLVSFIAPTGSSGSLLAVNFSLEGLVWDGGAGTVTGFSLISTTGAAGPFNESFTTSTVSGSLTFLSSGTALYRIEPAAGVPEGGSTALLFGLGLAGLLLRGNGRANKAV
jgi:hypothetical protein